MTVKELLLKEIESLPDSLLVNALELLRELKAKNELITYQTPEDLGYPPGFFEEVAGSWEGEPLVRVEQGEYQIREELL